MNVILLYVWIMYDNLKLRLWLFRSYFFPSVAAYLEQKSTVISKGHNAFALPNQEVLFSLGGYLSQNNYVWSLYWTVCLITEQQPIKHWWIPQWVYIVSLWYVSPYIHSQLVHALSIYLVLVNSCVFCIHSCHVHVLVSVTVNCTVQHLYSTYTWTCAC